MNETIDRTNGTSQLNDFNPAGGITEGIYNYSKPDNAGAVINETLDETNGTSLFEVFNPANGITAGDSFLCRS